MKTTKRTMITMNKSTVERLLIDQSDNELCQLQNKSLKSKIAAYESEVKELKKITMMIMKTLKVSTKKRSRGKSMTPP